MFLIAQGYDQDRIAKAISFLAGHREELDAPRQSALTPQELCDALKISMTTLWRLAPPHILVGSRKRYDLTEVREFLEMRQRKGTRE